MPSLKEKEENAIRTFNDYIEKIQQDIKKLESYLISINSKKDYLDQREEYDKKGDAVFKKLEDTIGAVRYIWKRMGLKRIAKENPGIIRKLCEDIVNVIEKIQVWDKRYRLKKLHEAFEGIIQKYTKLENELKE
jgi:hypothetical protein|tara:strand:+ start:671 stop:1072 length:402 start_codon:yes stop_codon:yes gene_type:complete